MLAYLWVGLGGALGSMARFGISSLIATRFGVQFPWGTLVVNVTGSLVIGVLAALAELDRTAISPGARQFLIAGICGGYTTFSSFSLQTFELLRDRSFLAAGANILLSVALCLIAVWLGYRGMAGAMKPTG